MNNLNNSTVETLASFEKKNKKNKFVSSVIESVSGVMQAHSLVVTSSNGEVTKIIDVEEQQVTINIISSKPDFRLQSADCTETRSTSHVEIAIPFENCSKEIRELHDTKEAFFQTKNELSEKEKHGELTIADKKVKAIILSYLVANNLDWNFKKINVDKQYEEKQNNHAQGNI